MTGRDERAWDRRLHIQTIGREDMTGPRNMPYEPTPYCVLERLAESGFIRPGDHLLDYGCGKGRVAFFMASEIGCRATGVDRAERLIAAAEENRARFMYPERIAFVNSSAESYVPSGENAFFFFNPFSEAVLRVALARILSCWDMPLKLCFYYPSDAYLALLSCEPRLDAVEEINCRGLFDGDNPRERILLFEANRG